MPFILAHIYYNAEGFKKKKSFLIYLFPFCLLISLYFHHVYLKLIYLCYFILAYSTGAIRHKAVIRFVNKNIFQFVIAMFHCCCVYH